MYFSTLLASAAALASVVVAAPAAREVKPPAKYYLQTKVQPDQKDCGSDKNDLWLYSYHTGAGLGDAALGANKSLAMEAYYNTTDSQQYFTYEGNELGGWPLAVQSGPYQCKSNVAYLLVDKTVADS